MYDCVADADSDVMFFGLALDTGRRSLANGSASFDSTQVESLGSTPVTPTRSVINPGVGISGLLRFSESLCARSSNSRPPFRHFALTADCPHAILGQDAPIASPSQCGSLWSLQAEFFAANSDQETR
jgi:hypothetical protein